MSRRPPSATDVRNLEAELRRRGFEIYCGPSYYDAGHCRPGKHPHGRHSSHFMPPGMAVDFGWPGPPIHDLEALHVELMMDELARHPTIAWRRVWNAGPGDHEDHGHVDHLLGVAGWHDIVRPRRGVRARDGKDLFVSPRAFPNHVPPTNSGYTLAAIVNFQTTAPKLTNPKTGKPFYGGHVDGYLGKQTRAAATAIQAHLGLTRDGLPGPRTMTALRAAIDKQNNPEEDPEMNAKLDALTAQLTDLPRKILDAPFPASPLSRQEFGDGPHTVGSVLDHTWRRAQQTWRYAHGALQASRANAERMAGLEVAVRELAAHTPGVDADEVARQIAERVGEYELTMRRIDETTNDQEG